MPFITLIIRFSVIESRALVNSSNIKRSGSLYNSLAKAISCLCPPEIFVPFIFSFSTLILSIPSKFTMPSYFSFSNNSPKTILSIILPSKIMTSCDTYPILFLKLRLSILFLLIVSCPDNGLYKKVSVFKRVLLPDPDCPTKA